MKRSVAVIGAGFAGLAAAWELVKQDIAVTVYEADSRPGGLASGFRQANWNWSLEYHYHHIFQTDKAILNLLAEMKLSHLVFFSATVTRSLFENKRWRLDSPASLLSFRPLNLFDRLRVGVVLAFLKLLPDGGWLERWSASNWLKVAMGKGAWQSLWRPLFTGKFGRYADQINMAWFWARIKARSQKLGYFRGGFLKLAQTMVKRLRGKKVQFHFNTPIVKFKSTKKGVALTLASGQTKTFDAVLSTLPSPLMKRLADWPVPSLPGLGAVTMVLELDRPFFSDGTYWLNIHEPGWPFLAVVEHTNMTPTGKYGQRHLVYVGKYLEPSEALFTKTKAQIMKIYQPYLELLSSNFKKHLTNSWVFRTPFAQPLVFKNHSRRLPSVATPQAGLFWTSLQHVYPWDRGTNYAVLFGRQAAKTVNYYLRGLK